MVQEPRIAAPMRPSGNAADNDSAGTLPQQSDGARSKNGIHPRREYNLLALEKLEGG